MSFPPLSLRQLQTPEPTATPAGFGPWPDGKVLQHPDHSVNTGVVKVSANDVLNLRAGPGTRLNRSASDPLICCTIKLQKFRHDRYARGGECYLLRPAWRLPMAPAAEGLPTSSDGLRLLSKLAVIGDMGTDTRQTARGCAGSTWPQSGAERWNYRQSDGKDDRKGGIRGYDAGKRILGRKRHIVVDVLGLLLIVMVH